jgi:hypothetical protein
MTESQPRPILKSILQLDAHHRLLVSITLALATVLLSWGRIQLP